MNLLEALTGLVVGMGRLGEHLLRQKGAGIIVAALAFGLGLGSWALLARPNAPACSAPLVVEVRNETARGRYESVKYETCRGESSAEGRYENDRYVFSLGLRPGASGAVLLPPPAPDQSPAPELDAAVNNHLALLRQEGRNVRVLRTTLTSLGGLPAVRVVSAYEKGGAEMVSDHLLAFRREGGAASVVYTIDLSTTLADYERDRPVLEAMRQTWHMQPPR